MGLFCVTIRKDSVYFFSRVRFRLFVVCNIRKVVFLPIFWFLIFTVVCTVNGRCSLFLLFLMKPSSPCIDTSIQFSVLINPLPPFLDTYLLSLKCKGLGIIFLILRSFVRVSNFKKGSAQMFNPLVRLLLQSLVSRSLLNRLTYSYFLISSPLVGWCPLQIFRSACNFNFFPSDLIRSWFDTSILSIICLFPLFIMRIAHFLFHMPFLYFGCIFLLFV